MNNSSVFGPMFDTRPVKVGRVKPSALNQVRSLPVSLAIIFPVRKVIGNSPYRNSTDILTAPKRQPQAVLTRAAVMEALGQIPDLLGQVMKTRSATTLAVVLRRALNRTSVRCTVALEKVNENRPETWVVCIDLTLVKGTVAQWKDIVLQATSAVGVDKLSARGLAKARQPRRRPVDRFAGLTEGWDEADDLEYPDNNSTIAN